MTMFSAQSIFSDNIANSISSLDLSLKTPPNWQGFLSSVENQTQTSGLNMVCSYPQFDYEIKIQQKNYLESGKNVVVSGNSEGWQYGIEFCFATEQQLEKFKAQDFYSPCIHIPMRLALKNMSYHLKHGLIKACVDYFGLGVFHINQHARLIQSSLAADAFIDAQYVKIRHGKISIAGDATWVAKQILTYQEINTADTVSHSCIQLTESNDFLHYLLLPNDELNSSYLLVVCMNERQVLPEALKCLMQIPSSHALMVSAFMQGVPAADVANQTGYSTHTVYSYIKTLYKEKEISRQAQLTAMLLPKLPHYNGLTKAYLYENRD